MPAPALVLWEPSHLLASLHVEPALASWDRAGSRSQTRLQSYLAVVEAAFAGVGTGVAHVGLHVDVRVPPGTDLLRHNDLENYLTPLAQRLRLPGLVFASATKRVRAGGERSCVQLWEVAPRTDPGTGWIIATPTGSATTTPWKASLREALVRHGVHPLPAGPVALEIALRCSTSRRNWVNLWKPAGDSLGPLLGEPDAGRPFNVADDRVTNLRLHLGADEAMVFGVEMAVRTGAAPATQPLCRHPRAVPASDGGY